MDSAVIQATIAAVSAVTVALISVWVIRYQRTGKLFWWRKPSPSPSKPLVGNHDSPSSNASDLNERGQRSYNHGQYREALNYYQQALVIQRAVGDRAGEGTTLNNIGTVYGARGQYDQALENYQQALDIRRAVGDRAGEGAVLANIKSLSDK